jgi:hypothetical protein
VFLRAYYAVFDSDNLRVGFANNIFYPPNTNDSNNDNSVPVTPSSFTLSDGAIAGIVCGAVILIVMIIGVSVYCYKKNKVVENEKIENKSLLVTDGKACINLDL